MPEEYNEFEELNRLVEARQNFGVKLQELIHAIGDYRELTERWHEIWLGMSKKDIEMLISFLEKLTEEARQARDEAD